MYQEQGPKIYVEGRYNISLPFWTECGPGYMPAPAWTEGEAHMVCFGYPFHKIRANVRGGLTVLAWADVVRALGKPWLDGLHRLPELAGQYELFGPPNGRLGPIEPGERLCAARAVPVCRLARWLLGQPRYFTEVGDRNDDFMKFLSQFWDAAIFLDPDRFLSIEEIRQLQLGNWWREPTWLLAGLGVIDELPPGVSFFSESEIARRAEVVAKRRGSPSTPGSWPGVEAFPLRSEPADFVAQMMEAAKRGAAAKGSNRTRQGDAKPDALIFEGEAGKVVKFEIDPGSKTIWASQAEIAELFGCSKVNVVKHIKRIFAEGELQEDSVVNHRLTVASNGKRYNISTYNLKMVIAVGNRIDSPVAVRFRIWVNDLVERRILEDAGLDSPPGLIEK